MIKIAGIVGEVGLEDIEPAVAVVVGDGNSHSGLLVAVLAVSASRHDGDVRESSIVIVVEQDAGFRVDCDVNIGPAVVIEIRRQCGDGIAWTGFEDARLFRNVGESAVAVVVEENIGIARETARAAHDWNAFPLTGGGFVGRGRLCGIKLDVIADEKVEMAVAIIVEECAACAPAHMLVIDAGLASDIGEGAVTVVVKKDVVSPETAEEIVPSVIVVVADADARLPAGAREAGLCGDIGKCSVAIVLVQMGSGRLTGRPGFSKL